MLRELLPGREDIVEMRRNPRADLVAGLTVAVVALPLALAFGIATGLGAQAGLVAAVVAGFVTAVFGGSALQVSGPTGAMTVVLIPIFINHGMNGVLLVGFMAGVILVIASLIDASRWMRFIPLSVIEGFTVGIAIVIGLQQAPTFFAVTAVGEKSLATAWQALQIWITNPNYTSVAIAVIVAVVIRIGVRWLPRRPLSLPVVLIATVVVVVLNIQTPLIGALPTIEPTPRLPTVSMELIASLIVPAFVVAALAGLESLLTAGVADAMSPHDDQHHGRRELFGQGLANLVTPLFGGMPSTAGIARTAVSIQAGARSRLAAIIHALALLVVLLFLGPVVENIPLAALAGVLLATVRGMINIPGLRAMLLGHRNDGIVLVATAVATIVFDLVTAVAIGVALSLVLKKASNSRIPIS